MSERTFPITPDGSVGWNLESIDNQPALVEPNAPVDCLEWLATPANELGEPFVSTDFASIYHIDGTGLLVKEAQRHDFPGKQKAWSRNLGFQAFFLNAALEAGLPRIGDEARLPNGRLIATPTYLGAYATRHLSRVIMSHEPGYRPYNEAGSTYTRAIIYDKAFRSVGGNPRRLRGYDDTSDNLLVCDETNKVIKLDACNVPHPDAWRSGK